MTNKEKKAKLPAQVNEKRKEKLIIIIIIVNFSQFDRNQKQGIHSLMFYRRQHIDSSSS